MPIPNNDDSLGGSAQNDTKCSNNNENQDMVLSNSFKKVIALEETPNNKLKDWDKTSIASQSSRLGDSLKKSTNNMNKMTSYSYIEDRKQNKPSNKNSQKDLKIFVNNKNQNQTNIKTHRSTFDLKNEKNSKNDLTKNKIGKINETPKIIINSSEDRGHRATISKLNDITPKGKHNPIIFGSKTNLGLVDSKENKGNKPKNN